MANPRNPPAFPRPFSWDVSPNGTHMGDREAPHPEQDGMTLRQWYAGQALIGLSKMEGWNADEKAAWAFQHADAMLAYEQRPAVTTTLPEGGIMLTAAGRDLLLPALQRAYKACDRTCMTKTPELAHHDPQCKYRVASEAYDTIAAQAREIAELRHDIERAQEASTALATELEAARAGAPQSSAEHFQREGILPDIIREALDAYDDFMGDDDYRGMAVLREIMDRMRKRFTPFDAAREAKP